jgi:hypothetical protein
MRRAILHGAAAIAATLCCCLAVRAELTIAVGPGEIKERALIGALDGAQVGSSDESVAAAWIHDGRVYVRGGAEGQAVVTITGKVAAVAAPAATASTRPAGAAVLPAGTAVAEKLNVVVGDKSAMAKKPAASTTKPTSKPATQPGTPLAVNPNKPAKPDKPATKPNKPESPSAGTGPRGSNAGGAASAADAGNPNSPDPGEGYRGEEDVSVLAGESRTATFRKQVANVSVSSSDPNIATVGYSDDGGVTISGIKGGKCVITVKGSIVHYNTGIPARLSGRGPNAIDLETDVPITLVYQVEVRPRLNGVWLADGYELPAGPVKVWLEQVGDKVTATKMTGNEYVPRGKVTWRGTYTAMKFPGEGADAVQAYKDPKWNNVQITVSDNDHLAVVWPNGWIVTYERATKPSANVADKPRGGGGGGDLDPLSGGRKPATGDAQPNPPGTPNTPSGPTSDGGGGTTTQPAGPIDDGLPLPATTGPTTFPRGITSVVLLVRTADRNPDPHRWSQSTINKDQKFFVDVWLPADQAQQTGRTLPATFSLRDASQTVTLQRVDSPEGALYTTLDPLCFDAPAASRGTLTAASDPLKLDGDLSSLNVGHADEVSVTAAGQTEQVTVFDEWPALIANVERQNGLVMGLRLIRVALGTDTGSVGMSADGLKAASNALVSGGVPIDQVLWQKEKPGKPLQFLTLDTMRLRLAAPPRQLPADAQATWYTRRDSGDAWQPMGGLTSRFSGQEITFRMPNDAGTIQIYGEVSIGVHKLRTEPISYAVRESHCQAFQQKVLVDVADVTYTYLLAQRTTKTNKAVWSEQGIDPLTATVPMLTDPATGKLYEPRDGDVVLRTGGPMGYTQHALGAPRAPQNHSGILKVETYNGQRVQVVHGIGWGYEQEPLTPTDAALYAKMMGLPQVPGSFLGEANVGTVEIYRPSGTTGILGRSYDIGKVAAARAPQIGQRTKKVYDALFLETCAAADSEPFQNAFYCHEFARECFGRGAAKPVPIPRLQQFWAAAFACDSESAEARENGAIPSARELIDVLKAVPLEDITFSADPAQDKQARDKYRQLIGTLEKVMTGTPIKSLLLDQFNGAVREKIGAAVPAAVNQAVADAYGIAVEYAPLFGINYEPALAAWSAASNWVVNKLAERELQAMIDDLGDALDAQCIIEGGTATGANGESVTLKFAKISR